LNCAGPTLSGANGYSGIILSHADGLPRVWRIDKTDTQQLQPKRAKTSSSSVGQKNQPAQVRRPAGEPEINIGAG